MAQTLWPVSSVNAQQTTLSGTIGSGDVTIGLNSVTNLSTSGGVLVIDRQDGSGNNTPSNREYITFTGISGSNLTGVTRGVAGSTAQSHSSGALVEEVVTVTHWGDMVSFLQNEHDVSGKHVISTATVNYTETKNLAVTSVASVAQLMSSNIIGSTVTTTTISTITLIYPTPTQIPWTYSGALATVLTSNASLKIPMVRATRNWTLTNVFMSVLSAPSTGVLTVDINYLSTPTAAPATIFSTKPTIDVGEYETVTAATPAVFSFTSLASGTYLWPEIETHGGSGDLMIQLIAKERT